MQINVNIAITSHQSTGRRRPDMDSRERGILVCFHREHRGLQEAIALLLLLLLGGGHFKRLQKIGVAGTN
jgi:hypothetical protein